MHELSQEQARRVAVRAQLLSLPRPGSLEEAVAHLGHLQDDPTSVVAPNAELVLWTRLGPGFDAAELDEARASGRLVELRGHLRPAADLALYRAELRAWPFTGPHKDWQDANLRWLAANDETRREVLERLRGDGPLPSSAFPDTTAVPWQSSGWNNDRSVRMLLSLMELRGEVAVVRDGSDRLWDLAERVFPDAEPVPLPEAYAERGRRRLQALGIDRRRETTLTGLQLAEDSAGEPASVEGVPGRWRVDPSYLDDLADFEGRTAILSPLDRLVLDRDRMERLFGFDYQLEMYKPASRRCWGYWAMPVLHGDRLVGKVDATADRDAGLLRVDAVHEDGRWTRALRASVDAELDSLAEWLGLSR